MQPLFRPVVFGLLASVLLGSSCSKDPAVAKQEYFVDGNKHFDAGRFPEAIIQYRNALNLDNNFGDARYKLAQAYDRLGDGGNAAREYIRAADLRPDDPEAQVRAGLFLLVGGLFEDARSRALIALAKDPRHMEAHMLLAQALASMKDLDGAVYQMEQAIRMAPGEERTQVQLGGFQLRLGQVEQAEAAFKRAVALDPKSTYANLGLAKFYLHVGRVKEAEEGLNKAIAMSPEDVPTNRALAALYLGTNRFPQAEAPLVTVARLAPSAGPRLVLADYYFMAGRKDDARRVLDGLKNEPATFSETRVRLSVLEREAGRSKEAHALVDEVLAKNAKDAQAAMMKGRYLLADAQHDRARDLLKTAVAADPRLMPAHYWLGVAYRNLGDDAAARAEFGEVLRLEPLEVGSRLQLVQLNLIEGKPDAAMALANEAVSLQPLNLQARLIRIDVLIAQGQLPAAAKEARLAAAAFPTLAPPLMQLGRISLKQGDAATAERSFQRAVEVSKGATDAVGALVDAKIAAGKVAEARAVAEAQVARQPTQAWPHVYAARAYKAGRDSAKAEASLRSALAADPGNLQAYVELSRLYLEQKNLDEARTQLEAIVAKQPKAIWVHTLIAISYHVQNRKAEARARYEKTLEIDPTAAMAANNLAMMLVEEGQNLDRALELAQTAKRQLPESPEVNDTLGLVYTKKGLAAQAIFPLEQSVRQEPANPVYHYHLGLAYAQAGQKAKARASLQQALTLDPNFEGAADAKRALTALAR